MEKSSRRKKCSPVERFNHSFETVFNQTKWIDGPLVKCIHSRQRVTLARGIHEYEILELHYRGTFREPTKSRNAQMVLARCNHRPWGTQSPCFIGGSVAPPRVAYNQFN